MEKQEMKTAAEATDKARKESIYPIYNYTKKLKDVTSTEDSARQTVKIIADGLDKRKATITMEEEQVEATEQLLQQRQTSKQDAWNSMQLDGQVVLSKYNVAKRDLTQAEIAVDSSKQEVKFATELFTKAFKQEKQDVYGERSASMSIEQARRKIQETQQEIAKRKQHRKQAESEEKRGKEHLVLMEDKRAEMESKLNEAKASLFEKEEAQDLARAALQVATADPAELLRLQKKLEGQVKLARTEHNEAQMVAEAAKKVWAQAMERIQQQTAGLTNAEAVHRSAEDSLEDAKNFVKDTKTSLKIHRQETSDIGNEVGRMKILLVSFTAEADNLKRKADSLHQKRDKTQVRLETALENTKPEAKKQQEAMDTLTIQMGKAKEKKKSLEALLKSLPVKIEAAVKKEKMFKSKHDTVTKAIERLHSRLSAGEGKVAKAKNKLLAASDNLEMVNDEKQRLVKAKQNADNDATLQQDKVDKAGTKVAFAQKTAARVQKSKMIAVNAVTRANEELKKAGEKYDLQQFEDPEVMAAVEAHRAATLELQEADRGKARAAEQVANATADKAAAESALADGIERVHEAQVADGAAQKTVENVTQSLNAIKKQVSVVSSSLKTNTAADAIASKAKQVAESKLQNATQESKTLQEAIRSDKNKMFESGRDNGEQKVADATLKSAVARAKLKAVGAAIGTQKEMQSRLEERLVAAKQDLSKQNAQLAKLQAMSNGQTVQQVTPIRERRHEQHERGIEEVVMLEY